MSLMDNCAVLSISGPFLLKPPKQANTQYLYTQTDKEIVSWAILLIPCFALFISNANQTDFESV